MGRLLVTLAVSALSVGAQALPFRDAPTLQRILERGGVGVRTVKPSTLSLTLGGVPLGLAYRAAEYLPFMEPGSQQPDLVKLTAGMTEKQQREYLENLKPAAPLGTYIQGVLVTAPSSEARSRQAVQRVVGRVLADCFAATPQQSAAAQNWLAASWGAVSSGKDMTRTFGVSTLTLAAQKQGGVTWTMVSVNFAEFGGRLPNQAGWTRFCREK